MTRIDSALISTEAVRRIFEAFEDAGRDVLLVGGCVRDSLLGRDAADIDMATDVLPNDVMSIATAAGIAAVPFGIEHGNVRLISFGRVVDVTTFRSDVETDGRHAVVEFGTRLEEDARRRDFTINALYARADGTVINPVDALDDLHEGRIRFIGNPRDRIREDHLRILRFFRFHAAYGNPDLPIDEDAIAAATEMSPGIDRLSRERITAEFEKLLTVKNPVRTVRAMDGAGVLQRCMPGSRLEAFERLVELEVAAALPPDWLVRLLALGGKLDRIRLSRSRTRHLGRIKRLVQDPLPPAEVAYRYGRDVAIGAALLRASQTRIELDPDLHSAVAQGSEAQFPLKAADLQPELEGKALGDRLKELESRWIASGFKLSRDQLVNG